MRELQWNDSEIKGEYPRHSETAKQRRNEQKLTDEREECRKEG